MPTGGSTRRAGPTAPSHARYRRAGRCSKGEERLTERQRTRLAELTSRYPALAEQHWCKERLRDLYRSADRRTAEARWTSLLITMEASDDPTVWAWVRTLRAQRMEIMGYFDLPITNGFTEARHTKIKLLKRLSYGYRNVQVYLRKMLLASCRPLTWSSLHTHRYRAAQGKVDSGEQIM